MSLAFQPTKGLLELRVKTMDPRKEIRIGKVP
jgi:hypothetical protein